MLHVILFIVFFFSQTFLFSQTTEKFGNLVLVPQSGHTGFINHISVSADNRYYLTSGNGKSILRSADGRMIRTFSDPSSENGINYSVLSPDGNYIVTAGDFLELRDIKGNLIQKLVTNSSASYQPIVFSRDSKLFLVFQATDKTFQWFDTKGTLIKSIQSETGSSSFDLSPDANRIISGGQYHENLEIWNKDGVLLKSIKAYSYGTRFVKFSPNGKSILTVGNSDRGFDETVKLWDSDGKFQKELYRFENCGNSNRINSLSFSSDENIFIISSCNQAVLMDIDGKVKKKIENVKETYAVSFFGKTILVGDGLGNILRYDENGNWIGKDLKAANEIVSMDLNENSILLSGGRLLNLDTELIEDISIEENNWGKFTSDNKFILLREKDKLVLYDRVSRKKIRVVSEDIEMPWSWHSLSKNNRILTIYPGEEINVLDLKGEALNSLNMKKSKLSFALISPDGNHLLAMSEKNLQVTDLKGKEIYNIKERAPDDWFEFLFSTNGKFIFINTKNKIDVYNSQGEFLFLLPHYYVTNIISSPDEKLFLTSSDDNTVKLWDQNGKLLKTISGYEGSITGLAFSKDGKFVLTSSRDGLIRFFKIADGSLAVSILPTEYGIIIISPDGRFDYADNRALQFLSYRKGGTNELISLDQVFQSYYTPDLFKKIINGTLPKSNVDISSALKKNLPELKLELGSQNSGKIDLNIEACDKGGGLQNIAVYQNGNLIHEENYTALTQTGACKTGTVTLNLADGQNAFKVSAYNSANIKAESPTRAVTYVSPESLKPQLHILMVAIDDYVSVRSKLKFAVKDAIGLKESLQKYGKGAFGKVNFYEVYNAAGVKPGIVNAFKNVKNNAKLNDTVIVFFSGHGMSVDGKFYFISQNITDAREIEAKSLSDFNQKYQAWEKFAKQASISSDEISQAITQIKAKNKMLIVDSCYSGGGWLSKVNEAKVEEKMEDQKSDMVKKSNLTGIAMISAAQAFQKANENGEIGHGFLTFSLLEAMKIEKDRGKITAFSVIPQAAKKVRDLSIQYQKKQIPFQSTSGVDFELSD